MNKLIIVLIILCSVSIFASNGSVFYLDNFEDKVNLANIQYQDSFLTKVYRGEAFISSHIFTSVANNGFATFMFSGLSSKSVLSTYSVTSEGKAYLRLYVEPTVTSSGTENLPRVKLNGEADNFPEMAVYRAPVVSSKGTMVYSQIIPGGSLPNSVGASTAFGLTALLNPEFTYLLEVQNVSGTAKDIGIILEWVETMKGGGEAIK